jgi:5-methylcytosine-specific restriction protein A
MTQFCAAPGCGVLVPSGRCAAHRVEREHARPAYAVDRWYRTVRWRRLRNIILREQPFCLACLIAGRKVLTVDVDHIRPHRGDPVLFWDLTNLQGLCKSCHTAKTMWDLSR